MASKHEVKQYLAYWFQLGKKVMTNNGSASLLPQPVIEGDRYSDEFETTWQQIISQDSGDCYLEGTQETIAFVADTDLGNQSLRSLYHASTRAKLGNATGVMSV